jgi:hypothetical protein
MIKNGILRALIGLVWLGLLMPNLQGQEIAFDLTEWEEKWAGVETREDLAVTERLVLQTEIVEVVGPFVQWRNSTVWEWTRFVLDSWESSADIELAREKYISLLSAIGFAAKDSLEELADETLLRTYYQRGLSISRTPAEEGVLLFHIATSLVRSEPDTLETRRRVETFIQQSLGSLGSEPPRDAVHLMLANLYADWQTLPGGGTSGQSNLGRAAAQCRAVLRMESVRDEYRKRAQDKLNELLQSGVQLRVDRRFLPQNNIRLTARTRNVGEVDVEVYEIPWMAEESASTLDTLEAQLTESIPDPARMVYRKSFRIVQRNRIDWQEHVLRLGDGFAGGVYHIRISAPGVMVDDLMLVSSLDATLIPRQDQSIVVWVADVDSGIPVEGADISIINATGDELHRNRTGPDGLLRVDGEDAGDWHEVQVLSGQNPAVVQNLRQRNDRPVLPWVISSNVAVRPGEPISWMVVTDPDSISRDVLQEMTLSLPDGSILLPQFEEITPGIWAGKATVPPSSDIPGPVEIQLPGETRILLTHLDRAEMLPLSIELSGEAFSGEELMYMGSSPLDVRIFNTLLENSNLPEYIRVVVSTVSRQPVHFLEAGLLTDDERIVYENIFNIGSSSTVATYFKLSDLLETDHVSVFRIEVLPLNEEGLLGEKYFAIVPYLGQVELRVDQHLLHGGERVTVQVNAPESMKELPRKAEGELVLYRETWESRYLHRKRGTIISEENYLKLPERSLLGSAKTDYRLLEEGFVREEVERFQVDLSTSSTLPIRLEKPGYYNVEFEAGESDYQPVYPEGRLEVWVIPENQDLRSIRSDKRRLIVEQAPSGAQEILLLLEDSNASVLVDLEYVDGKASTPVIKPQSSAFYIEVPARGYPLHACRTVVIGARETDHLYQRNGRAPQASWSLSEGSKLGLNPGSDFQVNLDKDKEYPADPALWSFFPEDAKKVIDGRMYFQQRLHLARRLVLARNMLSFGKLLPLYQPFGAGGIDSTGLEKVLYADPGVFTVASLFPELLEVDLSGSSESNLAGSDPYRIEGKLPNSIGKWNLTLFGLSDDNRMSWASWPVSTELPIRTSLVGPDLVRLGDVPHFQLTVENTTSTLQNLRMNLAISGSLALSSPELIDNSFRPGQRLTFPIAADAQSPGIGNVSVETSGEYSSVATQQIEVALPLSSSLLRMYQLDPSEVGWTLEVPLEGWSSGKVVASAGLGSVLMEIWDTVRFAQGDSEPLLVALGDWALDSVSEYHGIIASKDPDKGTALAEILQDRQGPEGGWSWSEGHMPDPWLTAMVLWSLETFSISEDVMDPAIRDRAKEFLEQAMVREQLGSEARLSALRSLAGPAFKIQQARPSRIQAKAFLEFLHIRDQLSNSETALLLQVARAYGFNEEVELLEETLNERLSTHGETFGKDFWDHTLVYFSLGERMESRTIRNSVLDAAYHDLDRQASLRGWKTVGGFMNLLAAFLLEGDFAIGGSADMSVSGRGRFDFALNPDSSSGGIAITEFSSELIQQGKAQIDLHSLIGSDPLTVAVVGEVSLPVELQPFPEQEEKVLREFVEETLLAGSRLELQPVSGLTTFHPGDTLQVHLSLYIESPRQFAELQFCLPGGASLSADAIQHSLEPSTSESIFTEPVISRVEQADPLKQVIRMQPLMPGRHEFILSYDIDWAGDFVLPAHSIIFPDTGEAYSLGKAHRLRVESVR